MIDNKYAKAYTEVLEIIKYFPEEEYNKIPKEKIEFYKIIRIKITNLLLIQELIYQSKMYLKKQVQLL